MASQVGSGKGRPKVGVGEAADAGKGGGDVRVDTGVSNSGATVGVLITTVGWGFADSAVGCGKPKVLHPASMATVSSTQANPALVMVRRRDPCV